MRHLVHAAGPWLLPPILGPRPGAEPAGAFIARCVAVTLANVITLSRLPLLGVVVGLFYVPSVSVRLGALALLGMVLWMDAVDGKVARSRGETSLLGSVLDIASDRVVELVLWVVFADLGRIPVWIPLFILPRGVLVDSLRGVLVAQGIEPFQATTSPLGRRIVQSRASRGLYGVSKFVAFVLLAIAHVLRAPDVASLNFAAVPAAWLGALDAVGLGASVVALVFCWVRGVPVLVEAWRLEQRSASEDLPNAD